MVVDDKDLVLIHVTLLKPLLHARQMDGFSPMNISHARAWLETQPCPILARACNDSVCTQRIRFERSFLFSFVERTILFMLGVRAAFRAGHRWCEV
jgi:hypothetical protein